MAEKPNVKKEIDKAEQQFDKFDQEVKSLTMDRMNMTPKEETEHQTKLSQRELNNSKDIYLKPERVIGCRDKFNEKFREDWEFDKQYVQFIAENKEIIGEAIEIWTRPYGGIPAEFWRVPVNKPVFGPRYLAEQIKSRVYHRLKMEDRPISSDNMGTYTGQIAVDTTIQRLDAYPVRQKRSLFMGKDNF